MAVKEQEIEASSTQELYMQETVRSCAEETRDGRAQYANKDKNVGHDSFPIKIIKLSNCGLV